MSRATALLVVGLVVWHGAVTSPRFKHAPDGEKVTNSFLVLLGIILIAVSLSQIPA